MSCARSAARIQRRRAHPGCTLIGWLSFLIAGTALSPIHAPQDRPSLHHGEMARTAPMGPGKVGSFIPTSPSYSLSNNGLKKWGSPWESLASAKNNMGRCSAAFLEWMKPSPPQCPFLLGKMGQGVPSQGLSCKARHPPA